MDPHDRVGTARCELVVVMQELLLLLRALLVLLVLVPCSALHRQARPLDDRPQHLARRRSRQPCVVGRLAAPRRLAVRPMRVARRIRVQPGVVLLSQTGEGEGKGYE